MNDRQEQTVADQYGLLSQLVSVGRETFLRVLEYVPGQGEGPAVTRGTCLFASIVLVDLLNRFGSVQARVVGGDGQGDGGYRDRSGAMQGHYWVELTDASGRVWVADVTADQFGGPGQVLRLVREAFSDPAWPYFPGDQEVVDEHVRREMAYIEAGVLNKTNPVLGPSRPVDE